MELKTLPNVLTCSRIVIIPFIVVSFHWDGYLSHMLAAGLFLLASVTDFFDGLLARLLSAQSNLGRFLDPIADKLLVAAITLLLVHAQRADLVPALIIVCREILVSGLREFLAELHIPLPVSHIAKWKTAVQMTALFLLLLGKEDSLWHFFIDVGQIALWIAALLTVISGYLYCRISFGYFSGNNQ